MTIMKREKAVAFRMGEPMVARKAESRQHRPHRQFGARAQRRDVVHDVVATIGRHPAPVMVLHASFHVQLLLGHFRDEAILHGDRCFELGSARAISARRMRRAALRPAILQGWGQMLQRLLLPELQQTRRDLVLSPRSDIGILSPKWRRKIVAFEELMTTSDAP